MAPDALVKTLLTVLDLVGTFVFALSGATAGVRRRLDFFGVLAVAFAAATSGGMLRDVLLGAVPVVALTDARYVATSLAAGALTFWWYPHVERRRNPVLVLDAAGLALFAVAGTQKALAFGLHPALAALLGMLTGVGGGMVRDVLLNEVPIVLRADLYALAALAGGAVVVLGDGLELPSPASAILGAALCFTLRLLAIRRRWSLPVARHAHDPGEGRP